MQKYMMVGADVHADSVLIKWCVGRGETNKRTFRPGNNGHQNMIQMIKKVAEQAGVEHIAFAYEACCMGFGLYDDVTDAGIECYVLAPTKIARSPKHRRSKCDEKDAQRILELLRGHLLAGNELPSVWVPDHQTRSDRAIVRRRIQVGQERTRVKSQIQMTLKRAHLRRPKNTGKGWTIAYRGWLGRLSDSSEGLLPLGEALALESLLRQLQWIERELEVQDHNVEVLSGHERYAEPCAKVMEIKGVGLITAMVFLTEIGDMSRFSNRRQIGAYFGLVPSSNETGDDADRKGHITKQGPWRVRLVLSQASWMRCGVDSAYGRIVGRNPKKKKIALVALMRRLGILMWHVALDAQQQAGCFQEAAVPPS